MGRTKTKTAEQPSLVIDNDKAAVPAVQQPGGAVVTATADPIFAIIERLSKDPAFDVEKMERLIKMHQSAKADNARAEFDQAMSLAQQEMMTIRAKSNSDKGKYASYAALDKAIRPIYTSHGFSVSFDTDPGAPELTVRLVATVAHRSGHRERRQLDVPADGKGAKGGDVMTRTHAVASAVTYGKRYLSSMIWNLAVDKDDDGDGASSVAERAKVMADSGIQFLNTSKLDKAGLEAYRAKQEKNIAWLKKNAPEEFERFQTAYSNAAESAGIKKEEPKRGGNNQSSSATSPHSEPKKDGQSEAPSGAGGDSKPEAASKPVTDVEDLSETEFEMFDTARKFFDFSDHWLQEPKRTPAEAKKWEEFYREKIKEMANHKFERIREAVADTIGLYSAVLAKEPPA